MTNLVKKITLSLGKVPIGDREQVKEEIGDFLINEVLRSVEKGFSPVQGEGRFKKLTKDYADKEKGGRRTSNLNLDGDLLEELKYKLTSSGINFGYLDGKEREKADGHNQHSAKAIRWAQGMDDPFPKRRYVPKGGQKFTDKIEKGIKEIIKEFEKEKRTGIRASARIVEADEEREIDPNRVNTEILDLLGDDVISEEIRRQLDGR